LKDGLYLSSVTSITWSVTEMSQRSLHAFCCSAFSPFLHLLHGVGCGRRQFRYRVI
jgi:hypothetical protein